LSFDNYLKFLLNSDSAASIKWIKKSPSSKKKYFLIDLSLSINYSFSKHNLIISWLAKSYALRMGSIKFLE
jgi:hypothetical protein